MENLIVASSNLVGILPIISAHEQQNLIIFYSLYLAMFCSILYHLFETEKHKFPGIFSLIDPFQSKIIGQRLHQKLINMDRFFALTAIITVIYYYYQLIDNIIIFHSLFGISCLIISEINKQSYWLYIITHCLWHIIAFNTANRLILNN